MPFSWLTTAAIGMMTVAVVCSVLSIWQSQLVKSQRLKTVVTVLRLSALAIVAIVLYNPSLVQSRPEIKTEKSFAVVIDRSLSMGGLRSEHANAVVQAMKSNTAIEGRTRFFRCGREFTTLGSARAEDDASNLNQALMKALSSAYDHRLAAMVFVSDGRATDSENKGELLRALVDAGVPVCCVPTTEAFFSVPNLRITTCDHPEQLRAGESFVLRSSYSCSSAENKNATAVVRNQQGNGVAHVPLSFIKGKATAQTTLTIPSVEEVWSLDVEPLLGETYLKDNHVSLRLTPRHDTIRVLYMEGSSSSRPYPVTHVSTPIWMFLPMAWKAVGMEVDIYGVVDQHALENNLYRISDSRRGFCKTRDEVMSFDVIICSDINRSNFSQEQLEWVRELVSEKGGGFLMIGGITSFGDGEWHKTIWDQMIPVSMTGNEDSRQRLQEFNMVFDPKSYTHPVLQLSIINQTNKNILDAGVLMGGSCLVRSLKPGATALAWHSLYTNMPVLAVQGYGRGRSMAFTSDAAGGWGLVQMMQDWGPKKGDIEYYNTLWVNAVRWLAENRIKGRAISAELATSNLYLDTHEACHFTLRLVDLKPQSVNKIFLEYGSKGKIPMTQVDPNLWTSDIAFDDSDLGDVNVHAAIIDHLGIEIARIPACVYVRDVDKERLNFQPDLGFMEEIARVSGGVVCSEPTKVTQYIEKYIDVDMPSNKRLITEPLWDCWWLLALLLCLLCTEWAWRKKFK